MNQKESVESKEEKPTVQSQVISNSILNKIIDTERIFRDVKMSEEDKELIIAMKENVIIQLEEEKSDEKELMKYANPLINLYSTIIDKIIQIHSIQKKGEKKGESTKFEKKFKLNLESQSGLKEKKKKEDFQISIANSEMPKIGKQQIKLDLSTSKSDKEKLVFRLEESRKVEKKEKIELTESERRKKAIAAALIPLTEAERLELEILKKKKEREVEEERKKQEREIAKGKGLFIRKR